MFASITLVSLLHSNWLVPSSQEVVDQVLAFVWMGSFGGKMTGWLFLGSSAGDDIPWDRMSKDRSSGDRKEPHVWDKQH